MVRGMGTPKREGLCRTYAYLIIRDLPVKQTAPGGRNGLSCFAGELEQAGGQGGAGGLRPGDDEDRIVAGDGAHHLLEVLLVDRFGDRLGTTGNGVEHDQLAHPVDPGEELRQKVRQQGLIVVSANLLREHVTGAILPSDPGEAEVAN